MTIPIVPGYDIRVTRIIVGPTGQPTFSEMVTAIEINDEAGGEFVNVIQHGRVANAQQIGINKDEWPALKAAIEFMVNECRSEP
jgi:hypothetical protein